MTRLKKSSFSTLNILRGVAIIQIFENEAAHKIIRE